MACTGSETMVAVPLARSHWHGREGVTATDSRGPGKRPWHWGGSGGLDTLLPKGSSPPLFSFTESPLGSRGHLPSKTLPSHMPWQLAVAVPISFVWEESVELLTTPFLHVHTAVRDLFAQ